MSSVEIGTDGMREGGDVRSQRRAGFKALLGLGAFLASVASPLNPVSETGLDMSKPEVEALFESKGSLDKAAVTPHPARANEFRRAIQRQGLSLGDGTITRPLEGDEKKATTPFVNPANDRPQTKRVKYEVTAEG